MTGTSILTPGSNGVPNAEGVLRGVVQESRAASTPRDSGNYNIWVSSDDEWLLQVSHSDNVVVLNHKVPDSDEQEAILTRYDGDSMGVKMLAAITKDPQRMHANLRDHPATGIVSANISIK